MKHRGGTEVFDDPNALEKNKILGEKSVNDFNTHG